MVKKNTPDMLQEAGQEVESQQPEKRFNMDRAIEDLVGAICDPIICYPRPWMDTLPEWLKDRIKLDRLLEQMKATRGEEPTGTDSEALAYIYPASLEQPMGHDWSQIYLYLATKVCSSEGKTIPDDIRVETLDRQQDSDLRRLKGWIYDRRRKHRVEKAKDIRKERLAEEKQEEPDTLQQTFDLGLDDPEPESE